MADAIACNAVKVCVIIDSMVLSPGLFTSGDGVTCAVTCAVTACAGELGSQWCVTGS